jgi:3'-phosphoadenosine 5'-phosphosulfate sulfotransferase (PAPS reductase)/FAD synthetase
LAGLESRACEDVNQTERENESVRDLRRDAAVGGAVGGARRLQEDKFIANRSISSKDKLKLDGGRVEDRQLVVSILRRIKDSGNV